MTLNTTIETDRLLLRSRSESAAPEILEYVMRNKTFLEPWEIERSLSYYTVEHQQMMLAEEAGKMAQGSLCKVWLYTKEDESRVIGSAALSNIVRGAFQSCHLGYKLDEHEQGNGYMTEALQALIIYAFEELKLHRIEANIMPRNGASMRVVQKLGFYEEGLALKYLRIGGVWEDHIHMVLRNERME
jgi:[ribosomal protein S5]-alanine N-acetyltransferase